MKRLLKPSAALLLASAFAASAQLAPPIEQRVPGGATAGQGAGYHDPRSAVKPLEERDGVVSWKLLSSVETKMEKNRVAPVFPGPVKAMNDKTVRVQGFMMPLEVGEKQRTLERSQIGNTASASALHCGPCAAMTWSI